MSKIIELYKSMLSSVGMVVDSKGFVSTLAPGADKSTPMMIADKRLVLPYPEQLEQPDWSNRIGFHPLLQNFSAGDSEVMDAVRNRTNRHYDFVIGMLFLGIATIAANKETHKELTPEQAKYMRPYSEADAKFVNALTHIVGAKPGSKKGYEFIRFSIVMGREWQGQKRNRVAVASFPMYDELPKENKPCTIAGQKLTAKQTGMLRSMFEFIFEHINEKGYYEYGSDSKLGPSIVSFFGLLDIIIANHNKHVSALEGHLRGTEYLYIPNEWSGSLKDINNLTNEIRSIPPLDGNAGRTRTGGQASAPMAIAEPTKVKTPLVETTASSVPVTNQQAIQQVQTQMHNTQTVTKSPFRARIGDNVAEQVIDPRTQLPENVTHTNQQPIINMAGYQPTPPVGAQLYQQQQQQMVNQQYMHNVPVQQQAIVQQPQTVAVNKVPEDSILIGSQMFVPFEAVGTAANPPGSITHNGKTYVPFGQPAQQQVVYPQGYVQGQAGYPVQQNITDPSQIPGLSAQEINFYRSNPVLFQNFLAQRNNVQNNALAQQQLSRQNATPPYLQRLAQQQQEISNQNRFGFSR